MHSTSFIMKKYDVTRREILNAVSELGIRPTQRIENVDGEPAYVNYYRMDDIPSIVNKMMVNKYGAEAVA